MKWLIWQMDALLLCKVDFKTTKVLMVSLVSVKAKLAWQSLLSRELGVAVDDPGSISNFKPI